MDRRSFLCSFAQPVFGPQSAPQQAPPDPVLPWLASRLNELAAAWDRKRALIKSTNEAERRNEFVRAKVAAMVHVPPPAPSLSPQISGGFARTGYRVENLRFQSAPGIWVTSNLYIPDGAGPFPAVISPCGHYELSRMHPDYQLAYQDKVRNGFVVLAYDPPSQGERRSAGDAKSTEEHTLAGNLLMLFGENLTGYMVLDGMRAIDYLLTRPEVAAERIACAGHSGGGTLTMFLACADQRIRCAVINEGGTIHRWPVHLQPDGRAPISDIEQNLFPAAVYGIDACDIHAAIAPRPLLATIERYSSAFEETAAHIRARYRQLNVPDNFVVEEAQDRHAWNARLRVASTDFLCRRLHNRARLDTPQGQPEDPAVLRYSSEVAGEPIFSILASRAEGFRPAFSIPRSKREFATFRDQITRELRDGLRLTHPSASRPPDLEPAGPGPVLRFGSVNQSAHVFDADSAAAHMAWYLDDSLLGIRVRQIIRAAARSNGAIHVEGSGDDAVWVLVAAALDSRIASVTCRRGLISWRLLALAGHYLHHASLIIPGALRRYDLPQIVAAIAPRPVILIDPVDAMNRIDLDAARREYAWALHAYQSNISITLSAGR